MRNGDGASDSDSPKALPCAGHEVGGSPGRQEPPAKGGNPIAPIVGGLPATAEESGWGEADLCRW